MCGRVTLTTKSIADIADELAAEVAPDDAALYRPRFNVAPSDLCLILEPGPDRRVLVPAVWGYLFPPRATTRPPTGAPATPAPPSASRSLVNVRGETLASGSGFRDAFRSRRCALVTDGFFEWSPAKAPFWYHREDGRLLLLAGIAQPAAAPHAATASRAESAASVVPRPRFAVVTTRANRLVAGVHDRMPVVLERERLDEWLGGPIASITRLLAPAPEATLVATAVSRRVSSVKHDDPACLQPLSAAGAQDAQDTQETEETPDTQDTKHPGGTEPRPTPRQINLL